MDSDRTNRNAVPRRELSADAFEKFLASRVGEHQRATIHCVTCSAVNAVEECLPTAAKFGQKPPHMFFFDGSDHHNPIEVFGIRPPSAFFCTAKIVPCPEAWDKQLPSSVLSAAVYAKENLKVQNFIVMGSNSSPAAVEILDHFGAMPSLARGAATFNGPLLDRARPVFDRVIETIAANPQQLWGPKDIHMLAALELTRTNARHIQTALGDDRKVVAGFVDDQRGVLRRLDLGATLMDAFKEQGQAQAVAVRPAQPHQPYARCCSCCDSRANGIHLFGGKPGEFAVTNSVAVFIPPHSSLVKGQPHSSWADIETDVKAGVPRHIVLGHGDCGGIKALVNRCKDGISAGANIDPWLDQARKVIEPVLAFAASRNVTGDALYELATKEIKKWSGRNIAAYTGKPDNVHVYFLEIDTRNVQKLDMNESMAATYAKMRAPASIQYLYKAEAPSSVYAPPQICPDRSDGAQRTHHENRQRLAWLLGDKTVRLHPQPV